MKVGNTVKVKQGSSSVFEGQEGVIEEITEDKATVKFSNNNQSTLPIDDLELIPKLEVESLETTLNRLY